EALPLQEGLGALGRGGRGDPRGAAPPRQRDQALRGRDRRPGPRQDADAAPGPPPRGRALSALRHHDRGGLLRRTPDELLPRGADRRAGSQGPPPLATAEVSLRTDPALNSP